MGLTGKSKPTAGTNSVVSEDHYSGWNDGELRSMRPVAGLPRWLRCRSCARRRCRSRREWPVLPSPLGSQAKPMRGAGFKRLLVMQPVVCVRQHPGRCWTWRRTECSRCIAGRSGYLPHRSARHLCRGRPYLHCPRPKFRIEAVFLVKLFLVAAEEAPAQAKIEGEFLVYAPVVLEVGLKVFVAIVVVDEVLLAGSWLYCPGARSANALPVERGDGSIKGQDSLGVNRVLLVLLGSNEIESHRQGVCYPRFW